MLALCVVSLRTEPSVRHPPTLKFLILGKAYHAFLMGTLNAATDVYCLCVSLKETNLYPQQHYQRAFLKCAAYFLTNNGYFYIFRPLRFFQIIRSEKEKKAQLGETKAVTCHKNTLLYFKRLQAQRVTVVPNYTHRSKKQQSKTKGLCTEEVKSISSLFCKEH